ncbi:MULTISPECIES: ABC transporter substrate-binding protein [unclassified Parafrankia]|uniref:ABC transporter substrate-binding protein n=1 Tax=unclassified Parafrankia TaxID=2994368 RepID=UPI000DA4D890|nr:MULTISPECIES: ABC transporter substrate-binding protein [unclassified Parafrankia]TCJ33675.1 ABC transporter substrate-binding protein [Parafrankia sp. BMG5.11]SQD99058.1 Extracellular solute-binding protein family 5 [Parafrankia sp. Ea1.12]
MPTKRGFPLAAVACCLFLVLAACGGGASPAGSSAAADGEPVPGGTARVLTLSDARSLDPAMLFNAYASTAVLGNALYGTLLTDDPASGEVRYRMAESFTTSDNGTTFELKLRPGLVFSDGTPLDAAAVKYNWDRLKTVPGASAADASLVGSTEVIDPRTLRITLTTPIPKFAQIVVISSMNWIASPAALAAGQQAFDAHPIGAGPFTLERWTRQDAIELVKNPRYWDAPKPYLDRLTLRVALDGGQRLNTVVSGGADVAIESHWWNVSRAAEAGLRTNVMQLSGGVYVALNQRRAPFNDVRARQALAYASDLQALNLAAYNGAGQVADTLFSKQSTFYTDTPLTTPNRDTAQRLFDELAAAGKPVSFTLTVSPTADSKALAEGIQAQLSAFRNVSVQIDVVDHARSAALRTSHDFDAIFSGVFFVDPEPRLWNAFNGQSDANISGVNDEALNTDLQAARTATGEAERKALYAAVQQRLAELVPVIFLVRAAPSALAGKNVGGLVQYGNGSLLPEELWIRR